MSRIEGVHEIVTISGDITKMTFMDITKITLLAYLSDKKLQYLVFFTVFSSYKTLNATQSESKFLNVNTNLRKCKL